MAESLPVDDAPFAGDENDGAGNLLFPDGIQSDLVQSLESQGGDSDFPGIDGPQQELAVCGVRGRASQGDKQKNGTAAGVSAHESVQYPSSRW